MSKARSYCPYLDTSVQNQKLLPIFGQQCPKSKANVQNLTLKHYCDSPSLDTKSPNPPLVTICLFLQSWEGLPSNLHNNTTLRGIWFTITNLAFICVYLFLSFFNSFGGALLPGKGEAMAHYVKEVNPLPWWDWAHKWWDCYIWIICLCDEWKQVW